MTSVMPVTSGASPIHSCEGGSPAFFPVLFVGCFFAGFFGGGFSRPADSFLEPNLN